MGIFGQETEMQGARIMPDIWSEGDSGFAAMGKPVPLWRQHIGYEHARAMGCTSENAFFVVQLMSNHIARDQPMTAMNEATKYLGAIGIYRLLAVLLTAENPHTRDAAPGE